MNSTLPTQWMQRSLKRDLSVVEKSSLLGLHTRGKALVMPGSPNTEIEELIDQGFDPGNIHGIEQNPEIADVLYNHYWDGSHIHLGEIGEWLESARNKYSYIHYDYCGHFKEAEVKGLQASTGKLDECARIRVSIYTSRRADHQFEYEELIQRRVLRPLLVQAQRANPDDARWTEYIELIDQNKMDAIQVVATVLFFVHVLGMDIWEYADTCTINPDAGLPGVLGSHSISNVQTLSYNEPGMPSVMQTIWVDFLPVLFSGRRHEEWLISELAKFMVSITFPVPTFNPEHYKIAEGAQYGSEV